MTKQAYRLSDGIMPIIVYADSAEEAHRILNTRMRGAEPVEAKSSESLPPVSPARSEL